MPRSSHGGRHELGQNFLQHQPTIDRIVALVAATEGSILELGSGDGSITRPLADLGRPFLAIDLDEHRVAKLQRALPAVQIEHADALHHPLVAPVVVGNIPFHLTTPILRRLLTADVWQQAYLLTQWEVARKRAGVGGGTMMTAQAAPWFTFDLHGRVPSGCFVPRPGVDGGILGITRRESPLTSKAERSAYERFVRSMFSGRGGRIDKIVQNTTSLSGEQSRRVLSSIGISLRHLPRDLGAEQWVALWLAVRYKPSRR